MFVNTVTGINVTYFVLIVTETEFAFKTWICNKRFSSEVSEIAFVTKFSVFRFVDGISPNVAGKGYLSRSWVISSDTICCMLSNLVESRIYSESIILSDVQLGKLKECGLEFGKGPLLTNSRN